MQNKGVNMVEKITCNIYEKLQKARVLLQSKKLKMTGKNPFARFNYYQLADFLPSLNSIFDDLKICPVFLIKDKVAILNIINSEKIEESITFEMPTAEVNLKGCSPIQALGGVNTYCKRYLYLNALEIVEDDLLDAEAGNIKNEPVKKVIKPVGKEIIKEDNDLDIYEGLKACDTANNAESYYKKYKDTVNNLDKFKNEYAKIWKNLSAKEKANG